MNEEERCKGRSVDCARSNLLMDSICLLRNKALVNMNIDFFGILASVCVNCGSARSRFTYKCKYLVPTAHFSRFLL